MLVNSLKKKKATWPEMKKQNKMEKTLIDNKARKRKAV
jgi:hypothetical protein